MKVQISELQADETWKRTATTEKLKIGGLFVADILAGGGRDDKVLGGNTFKDDVRVLHRIENLLPLIIHRNLLAIEPAMSIL